MALDIMKQMPQDLTQTQNQFQIQDPRLKYTLPTVTVTGKRPSSWTSGQYEKVNKNTGEVLHGYNPGKEAYTLRRTVTPYKTEEDIRKNTQMPSSVKDIDFIHNMHLNENDINNMDVIDKKVNTTFNVPRFLFGPHVDTHSGEAVGLIPKGSEQSKEQYRNNMLADVYKYYMLKNNGNRDLAWNNAQEFAKKEIDPLLEGAVYNQRINPNRPSYKAPGSQFLTSIVDDNYLNNLVDTKLTKQFYPNLLSEVEKREQMPESEIKNYAMDWLTKYKKMPPEQAEMYYKTLEENAKKRYEENYQKFKEDSKINMLKIMKGELGGVTGDKF